MIGEKIAADYLTANGYFVVNKNFRTRDGEIDLICIKAEEVIFVEVKSRRNKRFGWPEEAVTDTKIDKIISAGQAYLDKNEINLPWRIDVISIIFNPKNVEIKHLINIIRT